LEFNFLLYLPEDYTEQDSVDFPLLMFLHGGGESGDDIEMIKTHGPPRMIKEGKNFPFILLAPQNPYERKFWNAHALISLLDSIIVSYKVDTNRIYLSGMSRGGLGTWSTAMQYPNKFAAIAPICGASLTPYARWIKHLPIWIFHGALDNTIPVKESIRIADYLNELGANVKLTIYNDVEHNSWDNAYSDPELYEWLLSHSKKNN
jgi:predicted peptidase